MITIYHNPRCGKSRAALAYFDKHKIPYTIVEYLKHPPTKKELSHIFSLLTDDAQLAIRKKESVYKELNLGKTPTTSAMIAAIAKHPILLERPLVVTKKWATIARDESSLLWCKKNI